MCVCVCERGRGKGFRARDENWGPLRKNEVL